MIVLLDTDILIDLALDRAPHAEAAARLLESLEQRPGSAFVAWHSISNFFYLVTPHRGAEEARAFLVDLTRFVSVAPTTTESLLYAASLEMKDFEDAMQVAAAKAAGAEVIATRNLRDYANSPVPAISPEALVKSIEQDTRPHGRSAE